MTNHASSILQRLLRFGVPFQYLHYVLVGASTSPLDLLGIAAKQAAESSREILGEVGQRLSQILPRLSIFEGIHMLIRFALRFAPTIECMFLDDARLIA